MNSDYYPWPAGANGIEVNVNNCNSSVHPHMHDFLELVYVAQGSCLHRYRDREVMLIPGDLLAILPHETHSYSINALTVIYNCLFYLEPMGADWDRLKEINGVMCLFAPGTDGCAQPRTQNILHLNPADASDIEDVLKRMIDEQRDQSAGYSVVQKSNLVLLISMLGRLWDKQGKGGACSFNEKRNQLAEALLHIDRHFGDKLSIPQLASIVYMSPDHFRKLFKETTGLSTVDYINRVRISKSIQLLENRSLSIGRVSELVGIADVNYFTRLFHAMLGYTPTEYRKKNGIC